MKLLKYECIHCAHNPQWCRRFPACPGSLDWKPPAPSTEVLKQMRGKLCQMYGIHCSLPADSSGADQFLLDHIAALDELIALRESDNSLVGKDVRVGNSDPGRVLAVVNGMAWLWSSHGHTVAELARCVPVEREPG